MTRTEAAVIARAARAAKAPSLFDRFWSKVSRGGDGECWNWTAAVRNKKEGYGAFWLNGRHQPASKVAWILTKGEVPAGKVVCHTCDNPPCCNPNHLFVGTRPENDADRVAKGRQCRGSKQKNAILTEDMVQRLRILASLVGIPQAAKRMGLKEGTARDACTRSWRHV